MSEPKSVWQIVVKTEFSASHQLNNYEGKCESLHGHNFTVEAVFEGNELDNDTGILLDFKIAKKALNGIVEKLDHAHLNDLAPFANCNPSSELIAKYVYEELTDCFSSGTAHLVSVSVSEKEGSKALYFER